MRSWASSKPSSNGTWHDRAVAQNRSTAYVSALTEALAKLSWTDLEAATGTSPRQLHEMATEPLRGRVGSSCSPDRICLRSAGGYGACLNLLDLLLLMGKLAEPGCGFAPLAEENNDQGAVEMGAVAELLPGAMEVTDAGERATDWPSLEGGTSAAPGRRHSIEMIDQARAGDLKAMFVVGENPVGSLPAHARCEGGIQELGVVGLSGTLPHRNGSHGACGASGRRTDGKNRHLDQSRGPCAADPSGDRAAGESRPDWEILSALSVLLGTPFEYGESQECSKRSAASFRAMDCSGRHRFRPKSIPRPSNGTSRGLSPRPRRLAILWPRVGPQTDGTTWHIAPDAKPVSFWKAVYSCEGFALRLEAQADAANEPGARPSDSVSPTAIVSGCPTVEAT